MVKFEVVNELSLKITTDQQGGVVYTKAGAFIGGRSYGGKNYQFEKMLLGPGGNPLQAALGQLGRRFTGENLPLMKVTCRGATELFYANEAQHVVVMRLNPGETLSVESENILAFTPDCRYSVRFLAQGVISQKGLATSTITGNGPDSYAAIIIDGNPIVLSNVNDGTYMTADPDAVVAWIGADPGFKLDLSWKNLIGQASGESYMFEWTRPATVIIQPNERTSGIDIGIDGRGGRPTRQDNNLFRQDGNQLLGQMGNAMGGAFGGNPQQGGGLGGALGGILGGMMGGGNNGF